MSQATGANQAGGNQVWAVLSDPGHADSFLLHEEAYEPMRHLVASLALRPYAEQVFAYKSLATFNITTAATYQEADGHDVIGIGFNPANGLFAVGYCEWISPTRNPHHRTVASRTAQCQEAIEIIDRYVQRLRMTRRPSGGAGMSG